MKREHYSTTGVVFRTGSSPRKSVGEGNAAELHHMYQVITYYDAAFSVEDSECTVELSNSSNK